jgi:hypothetical protein
VSLPWLQCGVLGQLSHFNVDPENVPPLPQEFAFILVKEAIVLQIIEATMASFLGVNEKNLIMRDPEHCSKLLKCARIGSARGSAVSLRSVSIH